MKVYKYRSIDEKAFERDFKTLRENCFFAPNYAHLNDPFDIYFNEQITPVIKTLRAIFPDNSISNFENELRKTLDFKERVGIYCLSKDFLNEQLWAYYASSYFGYCIEYDLNKLTDKSQNPDFECQLEIHYEDDIPTIGIDDIKNTESFIKKIYAIKKSTWKHEDEIRLIFNNNGLKKNHSSAITGIYFGFRTEQVIKESFYDLFKNNDVKFYEVFPSNFRLERKLIYETKRSLKYKINKFNFEFLREPRENRWEQIFEVHYKGNSNDPNEIKEFVQAFKEMYCFKKSTLYIFNNKEVVSLLDTYPMNEDQHIEYNKSTIQIVYEL